MTYILLGLMIPAIAGCLPQKEPIEIHAAQAFATTESAKTGAIFMMIKNNSDSDIKLIEAMTEVADITEIHQNYIDIDDGMMMMRKVDGIEIKAGEEVLLDPAGYHLMLFNLDNPLVKGESFPATLSFNDGTKKTITVKVTAPGMSMSHSH